jgi:hypothetical protein
MKIIYNLQQKQCILFVHRKSFNTKEIHARVSQIVPHVKKSGNKYYIPDTQAFFMYHGLNKFCKQCF